MLTRAYAFLRGGRILGNVPIFSRLRGVEPATDAQPCVALLVDDDFLDRMETLPGLYLKEDKLVPARWDCLDRRDFWLGNVPVLSHGIEFECPSVLCAPWFVTREGHVEDIGYSARADHVVVVEEVTATGVRIDRHVLLRARERTAPCDGSKKGTEARGVEGITEGEEAREERALVVGEVGEGGEIARLVHLARGW